jgi:hypothetical protein
MSSLFPGDTKDFHDWWLAIFLWAFISSLLIHFVAGVVASYQMRGKPYALYVPVIFVLFGALTITLSASISCQSNTLTCLTLFYFVSVGVQLPSSSKSI